MCRLLCQVDHELTQLYGGKLCLASLARKFPASACTYLSEDAMSPQHDVGENSRVHSQTGLKHSLLPVCYITVSSLSCWEGIAVHFPSEEIIGGWEAQHDPATCACSPESQPYPGLHQEKHGQQIEEGDSAPLVCFHETPPGVLRPALEPPT